MQARAEAYRVNNEQLSIQIRNLNDQSSELEEDLKKVVQVCTRIEDPTMLEDMLPRLLQAVESERGEELEAGRVVDLLRRVEGGSLEMSTSRPATADFTPYSGSNPAFRRQTQLRVRATKEASPN